MIKDPGMRCTYSKEINEALGMGKGNTCERYTTVPNMVFLERGRGNLMQDLGSLMKENKILMRAKETHEHGHMKL